MDGFADGQVDRKWPVSGSVTQALVAVVNIGSVHAMPRLQMPVRGRRVERSTYRRDLNWRVGK
jgi:hypothetical protein